MFVKLVNTGDAVLCTTVSLNNIIIDISYYVLCAGGEKKPHLTSPGTEPGSMQ
jgi:hypothetical protein